MKKAILLVSFGTTYQEAREKSIGSMRKLLEETYGGEYCIQEAFTSNIVRSVWEKREQEHIADVEEALRQLAEDGIKEVVVFVTHIIAGIEYHKVLTQVEENSVLFDKITVSRPLLDREEDYEQVAEALMKPYLDCMDGRSCVVFMGHGTEHEANRCYAHLQEWFAKMGYQETVLGNRSMLLATVEGTPGLEDVIENLKTRKVNKIYLQPFLFVAGDHTRNDMAGDEDDSWKNRLIAEGYQVEPHLVGIGEMEGIRAVYLKHLQSLL